MNEHKATTPLLPCPFCGGEALMNNAWNNNNRYAIICYRCGVQTAWFKKRAQAVVAWKRRVEVQQ